MAKSNPWDNLNKDKQQKMAKKAVASASGKDEKSARKMVRIGEEEHAKLKILAAMDKLGKKIFGKDNFRGVSKQRFILENTISRLYICA